MKVKGEREKEGTGVNSKKKSLLERLSLLVGKAVRAVHANSSQRSIRQEM